MRAGISRWLWILLRKFEYVFLRNGTLIILIAESNQNRVTCYFLFPMWIFLLFSIVEVPHANWQNPNKYEKKLSSRHSTMNIWIWFTSTVATLTSWSSQNTHKLPNLRLFHLKFLLRRILFLKSGELALLPHPYNFSLETSTTLTDLPSFSILLMHFSS